LTKTGVGLMGGRGMIVGGEGPKKKAAHRQALKREL